MRSDLSSNKTVKPFFRKISEDEAGARGSVRTDQIVRKPRIGVELLCGYTSPTEKRRKKLPEFFPHDCNLDMSHLPHYVMAFKNGQRVGCKASGTQKQLVGKSTQTPLKNPLKPVSAVFLKHVAL